MVETSIETLFKGEPTTRERILDVAIDLISRKGFDAVSIREIAREVGIRESSIYNHFKSKDEILDTITAYLIFELSQFDMGEPSMDTLLAELGPEKFLGEAARAYLQGINRPRIAKIWRVIAVELSRNENVRTFFRTTMVQVPLAAWEQTFGTMMDLGYIRRCDTAMLAREFFYYCVYLLFDYFVISFDETTYDRFTEDMLADLAPHIRFIVQAVKVTEAP